MPAVVYTENGKTVCSSAFLSILSITVNAANIRPTLEMARPILEAEQEVHSGKEIVTKLLRGEMDNITQKKISDAIDSLKCTRIVIAHRLSTIRHADRIIFIDKGKAAEEGTYEALLAKNGLFAKLVERQRLDIDEV